MKKALKFWAIALCPALLALACEKELVLSNSEENNTSVRTITLKYPTDHDSKVSLGSDGKTAWEAGDQIFIHGAKVGNSGETYYSRVVTLAAENIDPVDGKTATFELEAIDADAGWNRSGYGATLFATYPASAVSSYSNGSWWYYTTPVTNTNTLLLEGTNNKNAGEEDTFTFKILSGALSFVISEGDYDSYVFQGNGGSEVVGYDVFSCRIDTQNSFGDKNKIPYDGGSGGVATSGPKTSIIGSLQENGTTNYVYFPGGVNLSSGFTIQFLKEGNIIKTVSTSTGKNIAMGKYLNLGDITSHLKDYVAPTTHDSGIGCPDDNTVYDLSKDGSANCYIVDGSVSSYANKVFKFKAYQGKSETKVGTIDSVVILWETWNNDLTDATQVSVNSVIAAVDYDKQEANDYYEVCFKMPETLHAGNALIAAKNAAGTILWSWHIWVPSTTVNPVNATNICGATIMDRNIGALVVTPTGAEDVAPLESFGMMYQWGRKDPFPGAGQSGQVWPARTRIAGPSSITLTDGPISMGYANSHPTEYAKSLETGDWQDTPDVNRWGSSKTVNDPCPPGYKIPYGAKDSAPLWNTTNISTAVTNAGLVWTLNSTGGWIKIADGDNVVAIPLAGYVEENGSSYYVTHATDRAALWFIANTTSKYHLNLRTDGTYKAGSTNSARGCTIRCVTE